MIAKNCFYVVKARDGRKRHKILDEVHLNTWLPKVIKQQVEMLAEKKLSADIWKQWLQKCFWKLHSPRKWILVVPGLVNPFL